MSARDPGRGQTPREAAYAALQKKFAQLADLAWLQRKPRTIRPVTPDRETRPAGTATLQTRTPKEPDPQ